MKAVFLLLLPCLFFSCANNGPKLPGGRPATEQQQKLWEESKTCARTQSLSPAERRQQYPFSEATAIQFVSFRQRPADSIAPDGYKAQLPVLNDTVCYSQLFEIKIISPSQEDSLSDLVLNYGHASKYTPRGTVYFIAYQTQCYNPKNAILFLDSNKNVFEFIEICFECEGTKTSSDRVSLGINCNQKLLLVKQLFKASGIRYGIEEEPQPEKK